MSNVTPRAIVLLGFVAALATAAWVHAAPPLVDTAKAFDRAMPKSIEKAERAVVRARVVKVDRTNLETARDALVASGAPQMLDLELFDGQVVTLALTGTDSNMDGINAYRGYVLGKPFSSITMTQLGEVVALNIVAPGFVYQVRYTGNGLHEVREIDQSAFDDHGALKPIPVDLPKTSKDFQPQADGPGQIDVLVAYTPAALAGAGGLAGMNTLIALGITETNDAYAASGVTQRLRLVNSMQVAYVDSGDMGTDLTRLQVPNDGFLDEVHPARDLYGADFVSLWVENDGGGCGIGYLMSTISSAFAGNAFNVTSRNCATGNYSFGHELGHNMGLRHDAFVDTNTTTPFPYAHGYVDLVNKFRTVMSYNDQCAASGFNCTRIKGFSNLTQLYDTKAMGSATADNATVLNATASTTANFRAAVASTVGFITDVDRSVSEAVGMVSLSVHRVGSATTAASVNWATVAGTATAGADFTAGSGTLNWAIGDTAVKTINVTILQDSLLESAETFTVVLSAPVNTIVGGGAGTSTIVIRDDEPGAFPAGGCVVPAGYVQSVGTTAAWIATTTDAFEGTCSLRSGVISNSESSGIETTATFVAGTLSFKYKVSSEPQFDCFRFIVDGVSQAGPACQGSAGVSGTVDWTAFSMPLPAGAHTLKWLYLKDSSVAAGVDAAFIDDVKFLATTTTTLGVSAPNSINMTSVTFTATIVGGTPTGTVSFNEGGVPLSGCSAIPIVAGAAACTTNSLAVGVHTVIAVYSGSNAHATSSSTGVTHTVSAAPPIYVGKIHWRHEATGQVYRQAFNGPTLVGGLMVYSEPNTAWKVVGEGDFDNDGERDLVYRNDTTGQVWVALLNATGTKGGAMVHTEPNAAWKIVHTPDLDGDGKADLLWWNSTSGQVYAMLMNGASIKAQGMVYTEPNTAWRIAAVGHFAGPGGSNQLLWRNVTTGQVYLMTVAYSTSFTVSGQMIYTEPDTSWRIVAAPDLDGNGRSDILWRNVANGQVYGMLMNGGTITSGALVHTEPDLSWKIVNALDLTGGGRDAIVWRSDTTGQVHIMLMNGLAITNRGMAYTEPSAQWRILGFTEYNKTTGVLGTP